LLSYEKLALNMLMKLMPGWSFKPCLLQYSMVLTKKQ
jgi:hypothetical protein